MSAFYYWFLLACLYSGVILWVVRAVQRESTNKDHTKER